MQNIGRVRLPDGTLVVQLGQGTWHMGENADTAQREAAALRLGLELGMSHIDTAEMYGDGGAERVVGATIHGMEREKLFITSKVYPHNAGRKNIFTRCEASLKRLGTDYLDLYLLHWRGSVPLQETVDCMEELVHKGRIRRWGVSNLDTDDMRELLATDGGANCQTDQVLYHLGSRGIEYSLLPLLRSRGIPATAYCPLAQEGALRASLRDDGTLQQIAGDHSVTVLQLLLAFVLCNSDMMAIPKAAEPKHVEANAAARDILLSKAEWKVVEQAFPAPDSKTFLDIQ